MSRADELQCEVRWPTFEFVLFAIFDDRMAAEFVAQGGQ